MSRLNCWEFTRCGREPGGTKAGLLGVCRAAVATTADGLNSGRNGGRICWAVSGTLCGGSVQGSSAAKLGSCVQCAFFQRVRTDQAAGFDSGAAFIAQNTAPAAIQEAFENLIASNIRQQQLQAGLAHVEKLCAVGELAAGVAHEISNPLSYVIANLTYLARELPDVVESLRVREGGLQATAEGADPAAGLGAMMESLAEAREGADRVKLIVRSLKALSRVDESDKTLVDVRQVVEGSLRMVRAEIDQRARLVLTHSEVPRVVANETRLGQVFLNLLMNAVQALPIESAERHEIRVAISVDDAGRVVTAVSDSGCGIPPEIVGRIFEPFFTTKPVGIGTGLGLSICDNIVAALGGELSVETAVGEGTTVRVILPACPATAETRAFPAMGGPNPCMPS